MGKGGTPASVGAEDGSVEFERVATARVQREGAEDFGSVPWIVCLTVRPAMGDLVASSSFFFF